MRRNASSPGGSVNPDMRRRLILTATLAALPGVAAAQRIEFGVVSIAADHELLGENLFGGTARVRLPWTADRLEARDVWAQPALDSSPQMIRVFSHSRCVTMLACGRHRPRSRSGHSRGLASLSMSHQGSGWAMCERIHTERAVVRECPTPKRSSASTLKSTRPGHRCSASLSP